MTAPNIARPSAAVLLLAALALLPASAGAAHSKALHFWSHQTSFVMRDASGTVLTEQRDLEVGFSFTSTDEDYSGTHTNHGRKLAATDHIACTVTAADLPDKLVAVCDGQIALAGGMLLIDRVTVNLAAARTTFRITGGTGKYAHVKAGTATSVTYSDKTDDTDLVIAL